MVGKYVAANDDDDGEQTKKVRQSTENEETAREGTSDYRGHHH